MKQYFEVPTYCLVCNGNTKIEGKFLICTNENCEGKTIGNLKKWAEKVGMKSQGLGEKFIERMFNESLLNDPSDFYKLDESDIDHLDGYGERSAKKLIGVIASRKELTLPEFIGGLNIKNWGRRMTDLLVENGYNTLKEIIEIDDFELIQIKGIEQKTAYAFLSGLEDKIELIDNLLEAGVTIKKEEKVEDNMSGTLSGLSFVFTGKILREVDGERLRRGDMQRFRSTCS